MQFRDEPSQSPTATAVPLFVACRRHLPPAGGSLSTQGEPLAEPAGFVLTGQRQEEVSRQAVNFSPLPKPLPFGRGGTAKPGRRGWLSGRTLSVACGDSSPEGGALGRTSKFCPHSSTAGRSQPISGKLYSSAKASPFRERWHGEAVTERVSPLLAAAFGKRLSKSEPGQNRKKRLCRRHTARFCSGDLHFWVQGGTLVVPPAHRK